ncbi:MAG: hypothetical protein R3B11_17865 [Nitrospira sp.]|jgi:hypothetical protein|nr:hypothetical protein [Fimbriimonadaceae bacterium]MCW5788264.1 hypothetical protein [Nitrospira sp.]MDR4477854.1 hypothetical protein [Nitrospira sp.]
MTCTRCDGLMVSEQMCDLRGTDSELCASGYRCLLCGDVVDATILANRRRPVEASVRLIAEYPRMPSVAAA